VNEEDTHSAIMKTAIDESFAPKGEGDLSDFIFEGEGEGDDEITELVKRSNT